MKKFLIAVLAMVVWTASFASDINDPPVEDGLKVGDVAPDFKLRSTSGIWVSLNNYENAKGYIVVFTCNHCPWAVKYEDRLIELHNTFEPLGYPVIAINPNDPQVQPEDSYTKMIERAKEKDFPFEYLIDDGQQVYPRYGATKTPHVYVLDRTRTVRYIGAIDDNPEDASAVTEPYVAKAIGAIERGQAVDPQTTKAIGCTIKTKKK